MPGPDVERHLLDAMMAHLVRRPSVFQAARDVLVTATHLNSPTDTVYAAVWDLTQAYYAQHNQLPGYEVLSMLLMDNLHRRFQNGSVTGKGQHLLDWIWGPTFQRDDDFSDEDAIGWLRRFLIEREVQQPLQQALSRPDASLSELLPQMVTRHDYLSSIQTQQSFIGMGDFNEQTTVYAGRQWVTGIDWIDERMCGGMRPAEVNTLLGPTGVGKTLLALQMFTAYVRETATDVAAGTGPAEIHVYCTYELPRSMIMMRAVSSGAMININHMKNVAKGAATYSTPNNPHPYDLRMPDERPRSESERRELFLSEANKYAAYLAFSMNRETGTPRGGGGIGELAGVLRKVQQEAGLPLGVVFIDWAGVACRRYLAANGKDPDKIIHELAQYVDTVRERITTEFNCACMVCHQLKGQVKNRTPGYVPSSAEAEYCSAFAFMATSAMCLGNKDKELAVCQFAADKTRDARTIPPLWLQIRGELQMMEPTTEYELDNTTGRPLRRTEAAQVNEQDGQRQVAEALEARGHAVQPGHAPQGQATLAPSRNRNVG